MFAEMEERKVTPMPIQKVVRLGVAREAIWVAIYARERTQKRGGRAMFSPGSTNCVNSDVESRKLRVLESRRALSCRR